MQLEPCQVISLHLEHRRDCLKPYAEQENPMQWKTPTIVEIVLGAEINSYVCGEAD